jgi:HPr kinase/phosphorylase
LTAAARVTLHGTVVALGEEGVLLLGKPGAGKSDLALRLIDEGGLLVADDQVRMARRGESLIASAPPALAGRLEIRGIGIVRAAAKPEAALAVVVQLETEALIERLPDEETHDILGVRLPLYHIDPVAASATARVRMALREAALRGNVRRFQGGGHETMMTLKSKT